MRGQNEGKGVVHVGGGGLNLRAWSMGVVNYAHPQGWAKLFHETLDGAVASMGSVLCVTD